MRWMFGASYMKILREEYDKKLWQTDSKTNTITELLAAAKMQW